MNLPQALWPASFSLFISLFFANTSDASLILNGSFENNTAGPGDVYSPINAQFNALVTNVTAYGVREGIDLLTNGTPYGLNPQHGNWAVGPASDLGGNSEEFSMSLTGPLTAGQTYKLDFYLERLQSGSFDGGSVQVGLSTSATSFGTQIASATAPNSGWLLSSTTFVAPNAGSFITVRVTTTQDSWVGLDNFQLNAVTADAVPEPSSMVVFGVMAIGGGFYGWRSRKPASVA